MIVGHTYQGISDHCVFLKTDQENNRPNHQKLNNSWKTELFPYPGEDKLYNRMCHITCCTTEDAEFAGGMRSICNGKTNK